MLQPAAQRSFLVKDAVPATSALAQSAQLALSALDRIQHGLPLPEGLKKQQVEALTAFENLAHKSQLTIPALAAFQKLVEASASGANCNASH